MSPKQKPTPEVMFCVVGLVGIEPTTQSLKVICDTISLQADVIKIAIRISLMGLEVGFVGT